LTGAPDAGTGDAGTENPETGDLETDDVGAIFRSRSGSNRDLKIAPTTTRQRSRNDEVEIAGAFH
jgi:hypothetical protein